jgi:hypothetical protein
MPVENGSLIVRGTFGMEPQQTRSHEDLQEDLRRLRGETLEEARGCCLTNANQSPLPQPRLFVRP